MWLFLNNGFFSIVQPRAGDPGFAKITLPTRGPFVTSDYLLVRARRKGDIERVFPTTKGSVVRDASRDYLYRCIVPRYVVGSVLNQVAQTIGYGNFKSSIKDKSYAGHVGRVWSVMADYQETHEVAPYSGNRQASFSNWREDEPVEEPKWMKDMRKSARGDGDIPEAPNYASKRKQPRGRR